MDSEEPAHLPSFCVCCRVKVPASNTFSTSEEYHIRMCLRHDYENTAESVMLNIEYQTAFNYAVLYEFS